MEKKSLLKSTSKKKTSTKAKAKTTAAQAKSKPKKVTTANLKRTAKAKTIARAKVAKKSKVAAKPQKTLQPTATLKPSTHKTKTKQKSFQEKIILKKFESAGLPEKADIPVSPPPLADPETEPHGPLKALEPHAYTKRMDPMVKMMAYIATGLIIIMALVISASESNHANYYLKATGGAVEIFRGRFAPIGKDRIIVLAGTQLPETIKSVYTKDEIYTITFNYYLERADTLLEVPGMPDFESIKLYLNTALSYGITAGLRQVAYARLKNIDLMIYLYKADVAASKGTISEYKIALRYLNKAASLGLDNAQAELIKKKIESIKELMVAFQTKQTKASQMPTKKPVNQKKIFNRGDL
ncbi:hypothetical protein ACFL0M_12025 [Thermodesulfobacteriota bacterium]